MCVYIHTFEEDLRLASVGVRVIAAGNLKLYSGSVQILFPTFFFFFRENFSILGLMWVISSRFFFFFSVGKKKTGRRRCI